MDKATAEQDTLLKETVHTICTDEFVNEASFAKSPAVKSYGEKCLRQIRAGVTQVLQLFTVVNVLWPAVQKANSCSTATERVKAANAAFYQLRVSQDIRRTTLDFLKKLVPDAEIPHIFFQMFIRILFEKLLLRHEEIKVKDVEKSGYNPNVKEQNALRYVAGYIVFKLPKKVLFKNEREQMEVVVNNMKEGSSKQTRLNYTKEWVEAQSRGGLCMVNDKTFLFFQKLEGIIRSELPSDTPTLKSQDLRESTTRAALENRLILDKWTTITAGAQLSEHATLVMLQLVVDFYVQIRLFSFTKNIVERCKIKAKDTKKKSKGLRGAMKAGTSAGES